jgi:hypothetical protein
MHGQKNINFFTITYVVCKNTTWVELHFGKKYFFIPHSFLVINVCNQRKTLCSPCTLNDQIRYTEFGDICSTHSSIWKHTVGRAKGRKPLKKGNNFRIGFIWRGIETSRGIYLTVIYRNADKSLARPTSRYILFDGESISFDVSLVLYIYIYIYIYI